jgi:tetratricopeptide (TPR) repeat protein
LAKKGLFSKILGFETRPQENNLREMLDKVDKNPKDIKAILKLGDHYLSKRKKAKAIKYYKMAVNNCLEDGFINKGIAILKKISFIDKKGIDNLLQLADLYMRQNLFGEAILQLQRVLKIDPGNQQAKETLNKLRGNSNGQKNIIEALKADREVQISSRTTTQEEIIQAAKEQIRKQITEKDSSEHYDLGIAYMEMELYESAIEEFEITLNNPDFFEDSIRLIYECFSSLGNMQGAISHFESLLELPSLSPLQKETIRFYLGVAFEDSHDNQKAVEIYENLLDEGYLRADILVQRLAKLKSLHN